MDSTSKFPIGGALGAALGYLLSQKTTQAPTAEAEPQVSAAPSAGFLTPTAPPASTVAHAAPSAPVEMPAVIPPAPLASVVAPVATAAAFSAPAVPAEVPIVERAPEPEVIVTRELLEEPLPGAGWSPSVPSGIEDETVESFVGDMPIVEVPLARPAEEIQEETLEETPAVELPVELVMVEEPTIESVMVEEVSEVSTDQGRVLGPMGPGTAGTEALAQAADVVGRLPVEQSRPEDDISRVDDLKSRIEETRRRIRHELEQPFEASAFGRSFEGDWTSAPAVPVAEKVEMPPSALAGIEPTPIVLNEPPAVTAAPIEEPLAMESFTLETVEVEMLSVEPVAIEQVEMEALTAEPLTAEAPVAEPVAVELSQVEPSPLVLDEQVIAEPVVEQVIAEPVTVQPEPLASPVAMEPVVGPSAVVAPSEETISVDTAMAAELETVVSDADLASEVGTAEPVDYDSMKNRIESTRSRLKAKAFDAMMTGESALLGRDLDGTAATGGKVSGVDDEVDETIETSLREEEE